MVLRPDWLPALSAFESAAASLMPLAIAAFRSEHPGVELSMTINEPEDAFPLLRSGEIDLALGYEGRIRGTVDGIARRHVGLAGHEDPQCGPGARRRQDRPRTRASAGGDDVGGVAEMRGALACGDAELDVRPSRGRRAMADRGQSGVGRLG